MRRTLIVGCAVGSVLGLGAVEVSAEQDPHAQMPPEKAQAVKDHHAVAGVTEPPAKTSASWRAARGNTGTPDEVSQVRSAVVLMLDLELDAGAMPRPVAQRQTTEREREQRAGRTSERIWAPGTVEERRTELLGAIKAVTDDPSYLSYTSARFVVSRWQGIIVRGATADVTVLGHDSYHAPGEQWTSGPDSQLQISLVRTRPGRDGWRMLDKEVLFEQADEN